MSGLENVSGSVLGGLIGGGKPDVKNVMNVVSVSQKTAAQFLLTKYSLRKKHFHTSFIKFY